MKGAGLLAMAASIVMASPSRAGHWTLPEAEQLLGVIAASQQEGLRPATYTPSILRRAVAQSDPALDAIAERAALALAHDYAQGAAPGSARRSWHIASAALDYRAWLDTARLGHDLARSYATLLPDAPSYQRLRSGLRDCRARNGDCTAILASMERWRWLPRDLGSHYLWVNVAAFRLDQVENGQSIASRRIIVGKPNRQTPSFRALVTGITINPWWNVPCSILPEGIGSMVRKNPTEAARRGYVASHDSRGQLVVRQRPGPENALGRVKLEMPNPYNVYIHDTPAKVLFDKDIRAYSHGCIRTDRPLELAAGLLGPQDMLIAEAALTTLQPKTIRLAQPVPVYVIYQTAEPDPEAPDSIVIHDDLYHRDAELMPFLSVDPEAPLL